jgi:hypothetical protein
VASAVAEREPTERIGVYRFFFRHSIQQLHELVRIRPRHLPRARGFDFAAAVVVAFFFVIGCSWVWGRTDLRLQLPLLPLPLPESE